MNKKSILIFFFYAITLALGAQNEVSHKIMALGKNDNRTMHHLDVLANRIGGRITGSDAYENATFWVAGLLEKWGLEVEIQEAGELPVGFNRGPWFGRMHTGDFSMMLDFVTPSYTSGTKGSQKGHVVLEPRTRIELEKIKDQLKDAWVLIEGKSSGFPIDFSEEADSLRLMIVEQNDTSAMAKEPALFYKEMKEAGILGIIQSASQPLVALYDRKNLMKMSFENLPNIPDIKLTEEQYKMIREKVAKGDSVILEFDIRNHFKPGPVKFHNVIGKIKGVEYPDEYVISGCHLDSYDVATGAVDCGTGVAPNLEMARLIMASGGNRPKRTILFCFWAAEEFRMLGSLSWVNANKDKWDKISNYFNRDGGPLAASKLVVPDNWYEDIKKCTEGLEAYHSDIPFNVEKSEQQPQKPVFDGGSDHASFKMHGIPVVSFIATNPLNYDFHYREIWHTNRDLYNKSIPVYMEYTSVTQAVTIYNIANLDHLLPRNQIYIE